MSSKMKQFTPLVLGLGLILGLLGLLSRSFVGLPLAYAASHTVCMAGPPTCAYSTIQAAVDDANDGDVIKVAIGTYTDMQTRPRDDIVATGVVTQIVYISKSITIRGGYTTTFIEPPNPEANPTTLDAKGQGRVLYITGNINPTIEGLHLTGGNAAGQGGTLAGGDSGGGVYVISATVTMINNQVFGNFGHLRASGEMGDRGNGGGGFFYNSPQTVLNGNIFRDNKATVGGGISFYSSPIVTLTANTISNNIADHLGSFQKHYGGVLFAASDDVTLINNTISGNEAANDCGGACFLDSDNVVLIGNTIISNTRGPSFAGEGSGLYLNNCKNASLISNSIIHNGAEGDVKVGTFLGGGVYIGASTTGVLTANLISSNEATRGGGIYFDQSSNVTLNHNTLTNNYAVSTGGAVYMIGASPMLNSNRIISNTTSDDGAGIFIDDNSSPNLINNIIARNTADSDGGGIFIDFLSTPNIINNTFVSNTPQAIFMSNDPTPTITNNIIVDHPYGIRSLTPLTVITLDYNDLWDCSIKCYDGVDPGPHDISVDPLFVDATKDDYHLLAHSPVIDMGTNIGAPITDFDDDLRPLDNDLDGQAITDIGADEFTIKIYLPIILSNQ